MPEELEKVDVVVVGMGWAGGIVCAELAKAGKNVVGLEKGGHATRSDYIGVKDELRFDNRYEIMQSLKGDTVTSRNEIEDTALPVRTMADNQMGTDLGGASVHWQVHLTDTGLMNLKSAVRRLRSTGKIRFRKI